MRVQLVGREHLVDAAVRHVTKTATGVLFVGEPGVGKTRLLSETLDRLDARDWHCEHFVASDATRQVPFGPLISLLPPGGRDRAQLLAGVRAGLTDRAAGRRTVVGVDDAHLLDTSSIACVLDLVHQGDVVVLATARTNELPSDLTHLWSGDAVVRIEVGPLSATDTARLTATFLRGDISDELADQVWELTAGVPLFVRELLLDARSDGTIERVADAWDATGPLHSGSRLQELVAARVRRLEPAAARLLELLALAEPVPVDRLEPDEGAALDRLEHAGLAAVEQRENGWEVRVDHPLVTEAIRASMPTRRRIEHLRDIAHRTIAAGCPDPGDALRAVRWSMAAGDPVEPTILVEAGRQAVSALDLDLAAELAASARERLPLEANLLLGEVLRLQAKADEAEAALRVAAELTTDDEQIVRIAMWRSTLRAHHAGDPAGAIDLLSTAADAVSASRRALELRSEAAFLAGILGRFDTAAEVNREILRQNELDTDTAWTARINLLYAQTMLGELDGVDDVLAAAAAMAEHAEQVRPEGVDLLWALHTGIAVQRGDLIEGERQIIAEVQRRAASDQIFGLTATILLQLLLLRGSPDVLPMADAALENLELSDPYAVRPIALACRALALAGIGELGAATAALDSIAPSAADDVRSVPFLGRARAAIAAVRQGPDAGAAIAAAAGREAIATSHVSFGVLALHDAVRLGRCDLVVDDLEAATSRCSGRLLLGLAEHARAQHARDGAALDELASQFARMGARMLVVDALNDAATAHVAPVAARRSAARAALWAKSLPDWSIRTAEVDQAVSSRELDVVELALAGVPSRAIAERLFVSVRTVDNHLRHVYGKLEATGRGDLENVLRPLPGDRSITSG